MLVLSRKVNQEIVIDGNIRIRVLKAKGNTIRLGEAAEINRMSAADSANKTSAGAKDSVEFTGRLPATFHRNRLQEIVNRMTNNN